MSPAAIAFLVGIAAGLGSGFAATRQHYTAEIAKIKSAQLQSELSIANAYNDYIKLEQENYAKNQAIVADASATAQRVRVRFPVQKCTDSGVHTTAPSPAPEPASGVFQSDVGAAFEDFRRRVERDIISKCDQINIDIR